MLGRARLFAKLTSILELAWGSGLCRLLWQRCLCKCHHRFHDIGNGSHCGFYNCCRPLGQGILTQLIARPVLVAQATMNPSNWDTTVFRSAELVTLLLGQSLWSQLRHDHSNLFLANIARPMSSFNIPSDVRVEIATAMSRAVNARGGFQVTFTPDLIFGLTPLTFVQLLRDWRLLQFTRYPEQIADEALAKTQPNQ